MKMRTPRAGNMANYSRHRQAINHVQPGLSKLKRFQTHLPLIMPCCRPGLRGAQAGKLMNHRLLSTRLGPKHRLIHLQDCRERGGGVRAAGIRLYIHTHTHTGQQSTHTDSLEYKMKIQQ